MGRVGLYSAEMVAVGTLCDYQLAEGHFPERGGLFPELGFYLCSSVLKCHLGYC